MREEADTHPLVLRRREIEQQFLDELTALTRKYGLEIKADTRTEYGETYPEHSLEVPYEGTEGRYVFGNFGVEFSAGSDPLPCTKAARTTFERAKKARQEEDAVIHEYNRRLSAMHWDMMDKARQQHIAEWAAENRRRPARFDCNCGTSFRSKKKLAAHVAETGHSTFCDLGTKEQ